MAVDGRLPDLAGIREYEQVHVWNVDNGQRFVTYAIRAEEGSGTASVNGAAALRVQPRHKVIVAAWAQLDAAEAERFQPTLVYLDADSRLRRIDRSIPKQAA